MADRRSELELRSRFERAAAAPPLMMLYPPVSTGEPYAGEPGAGTLWAATPGTGTLYLHIPFCAARCSFCPFYAVVGTELDFESYVETLLAEAALYAPDVAHLEFTSVYLGGGTPSVLPPHLVDRLLGGLARQLRLGAADVTAEAHPATLDGPRARGLRAAGVTRLSLGVQSFDPRVLRACGRDDTVRTVLPALAAALESGFRDVNIDLMYGLPEQTFASWEADLGRAARLAVPGLTLYATVYLPAFQARCEAEGHTVPTAANRQAMYELAYDHLNTAGYPQSHFGAGAFLRGDLNPHRRNVAHGLPTLALGTWGYSSSGPFAWHNCFPTEEWARSVHAGRLPIRQLVVVPEAERARKHVIEALLLAYLDLAHFRATFGAEFAAVFPAELAVLESLGLVQVQDGELRLTRTGGHHLRAIRFLFASPAVVEKLSSAGAPGL